jgi:hypothetical protein
MNQNLGTKLSEGIVNRSKENSTSLALQPR